jgi:hypothetical protein
MEMGAWKMFIAIVSMSGGARQIRNSLPEFQKIAFLVGRNLSPTPSYINNLSYTALQADSSRPGARRMHFSICLLLINKMPDRNGVAAFFQPEMV